MKPIYQAEEFYTRRPEKQPRYWLSTLCNLVAALLAVWMTAAAISGLLDAILAPVFVAMGVL